MSYIKLMRRVVASVVLAVLCGLAQADPWDTVPPKKATVLKLYMHPKQVLERMSGSDAAKTLFLDVRTPQEAMFVGMPQLADANVPYMVLPELPEWDSGKNAFKLVQNSAFVADVKTRLGAKGLGSDDVVIVMCRSGDRSAGAANLLARAGFTRVYSVIEGFEGDLGKDGRRMLGGWKNEGLPWSFELSREKMSSL